MRSPIPESLLEMHYFHVVRDNFADVLGRTDFHVFKPSSRTENWYGFDQAYFSGQGTTAEITGGIRRYLHETYGSDDFHLRAYFLQYKVVEIIFRKSCKIPDGWNAPYYRSELSLDPKKETRISQHETLMRANSIRGTTVCYVCPMIFKEDDVIGDARLSDLRFVDISTAPSGWTTNDMHYICFQDPAGQPYWCSEPMPAKLLEFDTFVKSAEVIPLETFDHYLSELRSAMKTNKDVWRWDTNPLPSNMIVIATKA